MDRSARWVRDLASLHQALVRLPDLASALTGEDGGSPLGMVAALHIGRVATPESLPAWLSMARTHPVREVKACTRRAAAADCRWPPVEKTSSNQYVRTEEQAPSHEGLLPVDVSPQRVCLSTPAAVREAFAESLDLYRAVEGHNAPPGEFVDSLVAEAASGSLAGMVDLDGREDNQRDGVAGTDTCRSIPRSASNHTPDSSTESPVAADARIHRLISHHDEIEGRLAEVVTELADADAWRGLGYDGLDDYARRGLGWSRSTLYARVQLVRHLRRLPVVRQAYQEGLIGRVAAQTIARLLTQETPSGTLPLRIPAAVQQAWVNRAATATIKRLSDEIRAVDRLRIGGLGPDELLDGARRPLDMTSRSGSGFPQPLDDATWHGSPYRQVGTTRRRMRVLTSMALATPGPMVQLRLVLSSETALALRQALAAASKSPRLIQAFATAQQPVHRVQTCAVATQDPFLVSTFSPDQRDHRLSAICDAAGGALPEWVALLALLQEFVDTWDVDVAGRRPSAQQIYVRDGWRCMAPGCTSRRNLETHHVVYRSRGGTDGDTNLVCLCRFHHQMGEHGVLAQVQGEAPLGLVWSLGRDGRGGRFRNELRLTG